jgi:hypothetical protein
MATHGEIQRPPVGRFNGRLWGEWHGRRQSSGPAVRNHVVDLALTPFLGPERTGRFIEAKLAEEA